MAAGTYNSDAASPTDCGDSGFCYDADFNNDGTSLTITGAGVGQTFINGMDASGGLIIDPDNDDDAMTLIITGITFQNCNTGAQGGGLVVSVQDATVNIFENEFINNDGEGGGGASLAGNDADYTLNRNAFIDNFSDSGDGGGVDASIGGGTFIMTNNVFAGNIASNDGDGGGANIEGDFGTIRIIHNSFYNNQSQEDGNGGGLHIDLCGTTTADVYNNIVYLNTAGGSGDDIFAAFNGGCESPLDSTVTVNDNDFIQFESESDPDFEVLQANNINQDPLWVNRNNDNLRLTALSPVIDQGDPNPPGGLPTPDFDGVTRPQGAGPDMGAFEFQVIPTPTPTASPTPTATPSPTPPPSGLFLEGSGTIFGCALNHGDAKINPASALLWLALLSLVAFAAHHRKVT
jgi:hypothetical protein